MEEDKENQEVFKKKAREKEPRRIRDSGSGKYKEL